MLPDLEARAARLTSTGLGDAATRRALEDVLTSACALALTLEAEDERLRRALVVVLTGSEEAASTTARGLARRLATVSEDVQRVRDLTEDLRRRLD